MGRPPAGTGRDVTIGGDDPRAPHPHRANPGPARPGRARQDGRVADNARTYDIVVYGASGFVGRLLAGYLAEHAPPGTRIALAGRSRARCAEVRDGLPEAARDWDVLEADAGDPPALDAHRRADPGAWPRRSGPTPGTGCRWSRPARAPARTTPTSPARCCSCGTRSTASTRWPGRRVRGSCTPAATTRSRRTSPRCSWPGAAEADGAGGLPGRPARGEPQGRLQRRHDRLDARPARGAAARTRRAAGSSVTRSR